jgi:hypothetical protein
MKMMKQLREIAEDIEYARRYYNANARDYNTAGQRVLFMASRPKFHAHSSVAPVYQE